MPVIVGVARSGTTLLRMMLDAHGSLAIPPETGFLPLLAQLNQTDDVRHSAWKIMTGFHTWPDFQLDATQFAAALADLPIATPSEVARSFYRIYAARFRKTSWGDKTPTYAGELNSISTLLPEARFIHIVRDGRDVALSVRNLWFSPGKTIEQCAEDWVARLSVTRALSARVSHYLEIQYEALVCSTESTLRDVCSFLDIDFDPAMLHYYRRAHARLDEHEARYTSDGQEIISKAGRLHNQRFVMEPPRIDRIGRWHAEMCEREVMRFESIAGEWLERYGYAVRSRAV